MFESIAQKKLIFVSGKGGVGKTYIATHLARYFESKNKKTLIIESSALGQLGYFMGCNLPVNKLIELSPFLHIGNVSSRGNFEKYLQTQAIAIKLMQPLLKNKIVLSLIDAIPGLAESMLLGRLYYQARHDYDHVIFDAPAFGHFLSLMTTPDAIIESKIGGPIADQVLTVQKFLVSSECATILVGQPEELVVSEMLDFIPRIAAVKCPRVEAICLNRVVSQTEGSVFLERRSEQEKVLIEKLKSQTSAEIWQADDLGFWQPPVAASGLKSFLSHIHVDRYA